MKDCQDDGGHTPLMLVCYNNNEEIMKILSEKSVDTEIINITGSTALADVISLFETNVFHKCCKDTYIRYGAKLNVEYHKGKHLQCYKKQFKFPRVNV